MATFHVAADRRRPGVLDLIVLVLALDLWHAGAGQVAAGLAALVLLALGVRVDLRGDRARDQVTRRVTLFGVPLLVRGRTPLSKITAVELKRRYRTSSSADGVSGTFTEYPVDLAGHPRLRLQSKRSYPRARRHAERLAEALGVPLRDRAFGHVRVRAPGTLDLTLGERLRRVPAPPAIPDPPRARGLQVTQTPTSVRLRLPPQPGEWLAYALAVLIPGGSFAVLWWLAGLYRAALIVGPFTLLFGYLVIGTFFPKWLRLDARGVRVRWFLSGQHLRWRDLEEVAFFVQSVYLLGDRRVLELPYEFDAETAAYVKALIEGAAWFHAPATAEAAPAADAPATDAQAI